MTTILLVDDNELQRKMIRVHLEHAGYQVICAATGRQALELARQAPPDLVVSDVVMDDLDGFGLCRRMREHPALDHIPILLLSSHYRQDSDRQLARSIGASELMERTPDLARELAWIRDTLAHPEHPRPPVRRTHEIYEEQLDASSKLATKLLARHRDSEHRMQMLLDNANDTITVWDLDGVILEANRRCQDVLGVPACDLIGRSVIDLTDDPAKARAELALVLAEGSHTWTCRRHHAVTGRSVVIEIAARVGELDGRPVIFAIGRDVTDRVAASERVAALESMYRSLVERMPDTVSRMTANEELVFLSPNFQGLTGIPVEEIKASRDEWRRRIHPEDLARVLAAFRSCLVESLPQELEYRFQHRNGQWLWFRSRITPRDEHGERLVDALTSDITARKKLEQGLVVSQKMEAIAVLTGGIAHDFNNVLSVILANSDLLIEQLETGDPRREDVEGIRSAAQRAATLTRQLLAFSRRQVLEMRPLDVDGLVAGLGKMLARMIGEHIKLTVRRGGQLGAVQADVGQLEQVVMNLVVNARDAMPRGGELTISTANVEVSAVAPLADVPPGRYVVLEVADTGCGMSPETQAHLFEPFFTTKEPGRGTGLGLSTVYGIVRQCGGHVVFDSELGKGTVFRVFLPRTDAAIDAAPPVTATDVGGSERVLLVEDDVRVRSSVERLLTARGYRVRVASTPAEAIAIAGAEPVELVLSDVVMPGMSGPEVAARVRELIPSVRVLLMSGYTDHPQLHVQEIVGGPGFIHKPFTPAALAKRVRELLDADHA